jgi:hypothetical protein
VFFVNLEIFARGIEKIVRISSGDTHYTRMEHISDHDLERYHLAMVIKEEELAILEQHLLICAGCIERAEESALDVDALRAAMVAGNYDLA